KAGGVVSTMPGPTAFCAKLFSIAKPSNPAQVIAGEPPSPPPRAYLYPQLPSGFWLDTNRLAMSRAVRSIGTSYRWATQSAMIAKWLFELSVTGGGEAVFAFPSELLAGSFPLSITLVESWKAGSLRMNAGKVRRLGRLCPKTFKSWVA